jgi:formylglycine-generating enzyme required for sulfatase activity
MIKMSSECAVNKFPPSPLGFHDVFGNVWQWTEDHNDGFSGFRINSYYFDFSTPCFDGRHNMIKGGSFISTGCQATVFGRFAFRRHFFQHAGIRLARPNPISKDLYDIGDNPHFITVNHWINNSNVYE